MGAAETEAATHSASTTSPTRASLPVLEKAVAQLELARVYIERDLGEMRIEMRDVRDRLKAVEVKVEALPSKVWIGSVVLGGMTALSLLFGAIVAAVRLLSH